MVGFQNTCKKPSRLLGFNCIHKIITNFKLKDELEDYINEGWEEVSRSKHKAKIQKLKPAGIRFEHDIWCMFYNLGFRHLNYDENLVVQWGDNPEDKHQLDVVAIGEEAAWSMRGGVRE